MNYETLFHTITQDSRYQSNLDWGEPRPGHPEGTVRAHLIELEENLYRLRSHLSEEAYWKLKVLVHVHDTFKKDASKGVAIEDPRSHASLARRFLEEYCKDADLLLMVQYHDEPYALYRQHTLKGRFNRARLSKLRDSIQDWKLFLRFLLVDGYTPGKSLEPLLWSLENLALPLGLEPNMRSWLAALTEGREFQCA